MADHLQSLDEVEAGLWRELGLALTERGHAWRHCVLATALCDPGDPGGADARTVVLREVDQQAQQLAVYTDERADKVAQLRARPVATMLMWSPALQWQLRCRVRCEVQVDGLAVASRWATLQQSAQAQDYLSPLAPGLPLNGEKPNASQRGHFALIVATVSRIDWLELSRAGHRRAVFEGGTGRWVQA